MRTAAGLRWFITSMVHAPEHRIHVVPLSDVFRHEEIGPCPCDPKVLHEGNSAIIVHNRFLDRRPS